MDRMQERLLRDAPFRHVVLWVERPTQRDRRETDGLVREWIEHLFSQPGAKRGPVAWTVWDTGAHSLPVWHAQVLVWGDLPECPNDGHGCPEWACAMSGAR